MSASALATSAQRDLAAAPFSTVLAVASLRDSAASEEGGGAAGEGVEAHTQRIVTLAEAVAAADALPDVIVARAGSEAARASIDVAGAPGPVTVGFATHSITSRFSPFVSYTLRWGGQRSAALDAARADLAAAMQSGESVLAAARRTVRGAWIELAADEQLARIAAERAGRSRQNRDAVAAMFDQGRVPRLDLARAETEATLAQSEADRADAARAGAASALAALLGLPPIPEAATGGAMPSPGDGPPMQEWIDRAVTTAPDVAAQQSRVHAAQARLTLAERQQLPGITLEAGAEYADPTQPGTDARAAIALTLPLDSGAKTNLAGAELARENGELARVRRLAAARTEAAWRTAAASRRALEAIDATAIPSAREAADLTRLAYREGKVDLFRLLDAEKALSNAESEKWQAFGAWGAAWADLLWFSGETPP